MSFITITADDQAGMAWYNAQTPLVRQFWHGMAGSAAPVDAWIAFRDMAAVCTPPDVSVGAEPAGSTPAIRGECTSLSLFAPLRHGLGTWCVICDGRRRIVCYPFIEGREARRS